MILSFRSSPPILFAMLVALSAPAAVAHAQTVEVLYEFSGSWLAAGDPKELVQVIGGDFYGARCFGGGADNAGTVFRMTPAGVFSVLYTFVKSTDGACPRRLIQARDGHLYGTASRGGAFDAGTVFRLTLGGDLTVLHAFTGGVDGAGPADGLLEGTDGQLYGTTENGGAANLGLVFKMAIDGGVTPLHAFIGGAADGAHPRTAVIQGRDGSFYGTAFAGGGSNLGTVFRMSPSGALTILHAFSGTSADGRAPGSALVEGADGYLYGATWYRVVITPNTQYVCDLLFRVSPEGAFSQATAALPCGPPGPITSTLVRGPGEALFWTRDNMGSSGISALRPDGRLVGVSSLQAAIEGGFLMTPLVAAADGHLYGTTAAGGPGGGGTFFRVRLAPEAPAALTASTSGGQVRLAWKPAPRASSYTVRRTTVSGGESVLASGIPTLGYLDTTVTRGQTYRYAVTAVNEFAESEPSYAVSITAGRATSGDFDGDGLTDLAVYRPTTGAWYLRRSSDLTTAVIVWGDPTDTPAPGDYDGDGIADVAVFRPSAGAWYIRDTGGAMSTVLWGRMGDIAVQGDYDGDGITEVAVFRPSDGTWHIRDAATGSDISLLWGAAEDIPAHGDYDGDGRTDVAIFRPSTSTWYVRFAATGSAMSLPWGQPGDLPAPGDYDGDGRTDIAVVGAGTWSIRRSSTLAVLQVAWGASGDIPVPGDYDGDGVTDVTVFQPSTGIWHIFWSGTQTSASAVWGASADVPATGDYDGDGKTDIAVLHFSSWHIRQSTTGAALIINYIFRDGVLATGDYDGDGRSDAALFVPYFPYDTWRIRHSTTEAFAGFTFGGPADVPVPGDYDGDGKADIAVFRPSTGIWYIRHSSAPTTAIVLWGDQFDVPVPADYDGDSRTDIAVFRPSTGEWLVRQSSTSALVTIVWGGGTDTPVPGDYDGDGKADVAVFRPSSGAWFVRRSATLTAVTLVWGADADKPVPGDYDGDGKTDIAVFRPSSGEWFVRQSTTFTLVTLVWGDPADVPVLKRP